MKLRNRRMIEMSGIRKLARSIVLGVQQRAEEEEESDEDEEFDDEEED
jgi:hypothetical protein